MNKIFLFILLITCFFYQASAQFTITTAGVSAEQDAKNFITIEVPGVSQADLFKRSQAYLSGLQDNTMSFIASDRIDLTGSTESIIRETNKNAAMFNLEYTWDLEFKDSRVKISSPAYKLTNQGENRLDPSVYDAKGKLRLPYTKTDLEDYFNNFITEFKAAINNNKGE
ncbi:MAG: hypothetical protein ACOH2A_03615 [Sphingobacteriaceae bacterium]